MTNGRKNRVWVLIGVAILLSACEAAQNYPNVKTKLNAMEIKGGSCTESLAGTVGATPGLIYLNVYDDEITGDRKTLGRAIFTEQPSEANSLYTAVGLTPRTPESRKMLQEMSFVSVGSSIQLHLGTQPVSREVQDNAMAVENYSMADVAEVRRSNIDGILQRMGAVKSGPGSDAYWNVSYMNMKYNPKPGYKQPKADVYVVDGQPTLPPISVTNARIARMASADDDLPPEEVDQASDSDPDDGSTAGDDGDTPDDNPDGRTASTRDLNQNGGAATSQRGSAIIQSALFSSEGLNAVPASVPAQPLASAVTVDKDNGVISVPITGYEAPQGNSRIIVQVGNANSGWYANCYAQDPGMARGDSMNVQVPLKWEDGGEKKALVSGATTIMVIRSLVSSSETKGVAVDVHRGRLLPITIPELKEE